MFEMVMCEFLDFMLNLLIRLIVFSCLNELNRFLWLSAIRLLLSVFNRLPKEQSSAKKCQEWLSAAGRDDKQCS